MSDDQPTPSDAATFWDSLDETDREALRSGENLERNEPLMHKLREAGMLFVTIAEPLDPQDPAADTSGAPENLASTSSSPSYRLARELVLVIDREKSGERDRG